MFNNDIRSFNVKSPLLKKINYLDLVCSVHVVTNETGLSYSKRGRLKKWHFLYLIYSVMKSIKLEKSIVTGITSKSGILILWTYYVQYMLSQ